jgi:beta-RFAP synthase
VVAPSRLHFGLLGFQDSVFPFGGVGAMLDMPGAIVEVTPSDALRITGASMVRAQAAAASWSRSTGRAVGAIRLHVAHLVDQHIGLGSGTQLAMAIAKALCQSVGDFDTSTERLAASVGRGERSSVGSLGFAEGGFIFERGHANGATGRAIAAVYQRWPIPSGWRFVICRPLRKPAGMSGTKEQAAFERLPPVPSTVTDRLLSITAETMIPALRDGDLAAFGESVYQYGHLAGTCFAKVQGGPFASAEIATIVAAIRSFGITGVGQSSWGPAVFAIVDDEARAHDLRRWLDKRFGSTNLRTDVVTASLKGAQVAKIVEPTAKAL